MPKRASLRKRKRRMPTALQIETLKRIFLSANTDFDDLYAEMDNLDFDILDSTLSFKENLEEFKENYPQYRWEVPKKEKPLGEERPVWQSKLDLKSNSLIHTAIVLVKPHKVTAKNRTYLHGRIQVTVDRKWIGRKAKVSIRVPVGKFRGTDFK